MTDYEPKPCAECGTTYTPKRKNNIYCSGKCAYKVYNRKRREKAQETSRQWRKDNADRARATAKAYRAANLGSETARKRRWLEDPDNKERHRASMNRWAIRNPDKVPTYKLRRAQAELAGNATRKLIDAKWEASNKTCCLCGSPIDDTLKSPDPMSITLEHITPIARGGRHDIDNIDFAHRACNTKKGAKTLEEYKKRATRVA